jgi:hypothetical protein
VSWSIAAALHQAVLDATRRMTDPGLAARVLAAEGRIIAAEADARAQRVAAICARPWRDEFGLLRCARCAGALTPNLKGITVNPCSCPSRTEASAVA